MATTGKLIDPFIRSRNRHFFTAWQRQIGGSSSRRTGFHAGFYHVGKTRRQWYAKHYVGNGYLAGNAESGQSITQCDCGCRRDPGHLAGAEREVPLAQLGYAGLLLKSTYHCNNANIDHDVTIQINGNTCNVVRKEVN
jgi:hypothetical protein